jgi:hypothetical protein
VHPPDRTKKKKKPLQPLHWKSRPPLFTGFNRVKISPTPSTCWMEGIFALGWPDWAYYFREAPLTTGWWDAAIGHEPYVNVNNLGCDPLSTSEP